MIRVVDGIHWCILRYPDAQNDFKFRASTQIRSVCGSAIPSTLFSKQDAGRRSRRFIGGALLPCSSGKVQILTRAHRMLAAASSGKSRIKIH